jgi:transcriptional regulator with XRE-family HTH domain
MPDTSFDAAAFFAALDAQRGKKTWRQVATEAGVSASTLTRISQGRKPDVDGLAALLAWSGLNAGDFIRGTAPAATPNTVARISTSLRADKALSPQSVAAIERIVQAAYEGMRENDDESPARVQK